MTYVVTENCIRCKYTDCVDVCPVDCFHEGERFLVIDPDVCIDCGVCVPECPVEAIVENMRNRGRSSAPRRTRLPMRTFGPITPTS